MTVFWTVIGVLCLAYYAVIAICAGPTANFGWFWIALGIVCIVIALLNRRGSAALNGNASVILRTILTVLVIAGFVTLVLASVFIVRGMREDASSDLDCAIVLGAQVKGTEPSRALTKRLERAKAFAEQNPDAVLILSGGQGDHEEISEAQCMYDYLTEHGIDPDRMILEDRSTSTAENLHFSDQLTECASGPCGIISNDFHILRAKLIAERQGYAEARGIPAQGDPVMELHYIVREAAALIVGRIRGTL